MFPALQIGGGVRSQTQIEELLAKVRMRRGTPIVRTTSLEIARERAREDDPIFGARRLLQLLGR